ncbi:MAG: sugar ABC transporter permease [Gallionellaceae bacterium]|nr:sugar ABC transporter permease [Gallionellaceae bacterium]
MLVPVALMFIITFAAPMVLVVRLAFLESNYVTETYVGLKNFTDALRDKYFVKSFVNVLIFLVPLVPITVIMTYGGTSLLTRFSERSQTVGRFISYLPNMTAGIIIALMWRWLLKRDGLINQYIVAFGGKSVPWLTQPWTARLSLIMVSLSSGPGALVVMCSAAMKAIPVELHDQAIVDGASESQYRKLIVRPLMMPTILLIVLLIIVGTMQAWETIFILTGSGGPKGSTATPVYQIFQTAFMSSEPGYAAAKGLILLVVIAVMVIIKQRFEKWAGANL